MLVPPMVSAEKSKEMSENLTALRRCNKVYKYVFLLNAAAVLITLGCVFFQLIGSILMLTNFLHTLIPFCFLMPGAAVSAIYSGYRRKDVFAVFSPVLALIGVLLRPLMGIMLSADILSAMLVLFANAKYRYLEQQEGYPHFNPLLHEQLQRAEDFHIHDPYKELARKLKKNAANSMDNIHKDERELSPKSSGSQKRFMDEI